MRSGIGLKTAEVITMGESAHSKLSKRARDFLSFRQHPIKIVKYMAKYLWLLLFSLAKYLIASQFDIKSWLEANWFDLIILFVIFGFAFIRWALVYFELGQDRIITHTGFMGMTTTVVFFEDISSVSLCQGPISYLVHNCEMYIDTDADSVQATDIRIDLTKSRAMEIYHLVSQKAKAQPGFVFKSPKKQLVIFSLLFSSAISGMIVLLTILYQAYLITDSEFNKRLLDEVNSQIQIIRNSGIWIYFLVAGLLIGFIWAMSFLSNLLRHWDFTCKRSKDYLRIHSGKGSRRHHMLRRKYINYLDFTQSFFMRIFNICSVEVSCTGYGKRHKEISALIPITTSKDAVFSAKLLEPEFSLCKAQVRTGKKNIPGFIALPVTAALIPMVAASVMMYFFEHIKTQIIFIEVMAALPFLWLIVVKCEAAVSTSMGFEGDNVTLSYCRWYTFHKVALKKQRITKVTIKRNPLARLFGTCTVVIYNTGEDSHKHRIGGVDYNKALSILGQNGFSFISDGAADSARSAQ